MRQPLDEDPPGDAASHLRHEINLEGRREAEQLEVVESERRRNLRFSRSMRRAQSTGRWYLDEPQRPEHEDPVWQHTRGRPNGSKASEDGLPVRDDDVALRSSHQHAKRAVPSIRDGDAEHVLDTRSREDRVNSQPL